MKSTINKVCLFYAPYTSPAKSLRYQFLQACGPMVVTLSFLIISATWVFSRVGIVFGMIFMAVMAIVLRTIYSGMMYSVSFLTEDGENYVSPSVVGQIELFSALAQLVVAFVGAKTFIHFLA